MFDQSSGSQKIQSREASAWIDLVNALESSGNFKDTKSIVRQLDDPTCENNARNQHNDIMLA